ncbi:MAG: 1-acyl-sn-glycerol-3-phosphate acyltransferase [Solirubrobacteraceae bacterium]|jgi:1-acyl-sn-glycerol-3-phosphate acyltransferase|nr:1-acyl-sn-glycerol-3-phosphate acyltransferase [Solirubrobacteraceae bacterium]
MDQEELLERARTRGVNRVLLRLARLTMTPFFRVWFRLGRIGREHLPKDGPLILAANHRSFLDPFVIGAMVDRPIYFVAKKELFTKPGLYGRLASWFISSLGAFPIDRGTGDADSMRTAREILERGDAVMIFPEGTRVRPGPLGHPRRGVGRLALETGAAVAPVAVIGTETIRRGWRIRPHRVTIRAGRALRFPQVEQPSPALAKAVTDRIWPCVELQWEALGGSAPLRRVAVIGAGSWGTGLAVALSRAGITVDLGCRTAEQARTLLADRENRRYLPGVRLPDAIRPQRGGDLALADADAVVLAVPARALPAVAGDLGGRLAPGTGVLVCSKGLVGPSGDLPSAFCAARFPGHPVGCLGGPGHAADAVEHGASLVVASADPDLVARVRRALADAGFDVETTLDVAGVDLAGVAKNAAVLAAATASAAGPNASGSAAGKVFAEVARSAERLGARQETLIGLAGAGDLVASVVAAGGRNRRAGELLARGVPSHEIQPAIGQVAEALDTLPLLAHRLEQARVRAPATSALAAVVAGRATATGFADEITRPRRVVGTKVVG